MGIKNDLHTDLRYASWFNWWILTVWLLQWLLALTFSRFARWKGQHGGRQLWASLALLPVYERTLLLKKMALIAMILTAGFSPDFTQKFSTASGFALYLHVFALKMYDATYVSVLYVLCAASAGTVTLWHATVLSLAVAFVMSIIVVFEETGDVNFWISEHNRQSNATEALWPSFSGGVGPSEFVTSAPMPNQQVTGKFIADVGVAFWVAVAQTGVGILVAVGYTGRMWHPRQPRLFAMLYLLMLTMSMWNYCWFWHSVKEAFDFRPFLVLAICEMPVKYYIMLQDSTYWSSLSLSNAVFSAKCLDSLDPQLADPLLREAADTMLELRDPVSAPKVPHIHQALLVVETANLRLGSGACSTVYRAKLKQLPVAVKAILCKHLSSDDLRKYCYEAIIANQLRGHPNIVEHKGFSVSPPYIHLVMQECNGSVHELLHARPQQPLTTHQRQQLSLSATQGVVHLHSKGLIHRDLKSPNFLYTQEGHVFTSLLCDFGEATTVAFAASGGDSEEGLIGTPAWTAPELSRVPRVYSQQSDVYALALVVFECLSGLPLVLETIEYQSSIEGVFDFADATIHGGRPSVKKLAPEWGPAVCTALTVGWAQEPSGRGLASALTSALQEAAVGANSDD